MLRLSTTRMSLRQLWNIKAGVGHYTPIKQLAWVEDPWRTTSITTCSLKEADQGLEPERSRQALKVPTS